jgi:TonB family protein
MLTNRQDPECGGGWQEGHSRWWLLPLLLVAVSGCGDSEQVQREPMNPRASMADVPAPAATEEARAPGLASALPDARDARGAGGPYHCLGQPPQHGGAVEYSSPPVAEDRGQIVRVLTQEYRQLAGESGASGTVQVLFLVDTLGAVSEVRVTRSSGTAVLDSVAVRGLSLVRFRPAYLDEQAICMWVAIPVVLPPPGGLSPGGSRTPVEGGGS